MPVSFTHEGLTIRTFDVPPPGFDPDSATEEEREAYGLSRLSSGAAEAHRDWAARAKGYRFIVPTFTSRISARKRLPAFKRLHSPETHDTWSGGVTFPPSGGTLAWVRGKWQVPAVALPAGAHEGDSYCASTWVGLDGDDGSNDVLQVGCDATVRRVAGKPQQRYRLWYEWYPTGTQWLDNVAVSANDQLDCLIALKTGSQTSASISLSNETTKLAHTYEVTSPVALSGNCAEWIIEAFGTLDPLANYGNVLFRDCSSGTADGRTVTADSGKAINMVDAGGNVLSSGTIPNPTEVQISYA